MSDRTEESAESLSAHLTRLYADDRREHSSVPPMDTPEYEALRARDRERREQALVALGRLRGIQQPAPADLYHVACLLQHGDDIPEFERAHALAREAAAAGHRPARWLAAAAYDRARMHAGEPQRYGTQIVPDGVGHRVWDVDPSVTDDERREWDVPPLAEQVARAEALSRSAPQPPMENAPSWLTAAIARWRGSDSSTGGS